MAEQTGPQLQGGVYSLGILYPDPQSEIPDSYAKVWGEFADLAFDPAWINDGSAGITNVWDNFYIRRASWYRLVRSMRRDPTINLARVLSVAPALASNWSFEETEDAPEGARDFIAKQFEPHRMQLLETGFLGCMDFGWQPFEKVKEYDSRIGKIVYRKFKPLLQDITQILIVPENGAFRGLRQFLLNKPFDVKQCVELDVGDCLLFYIDVEGTNWYGQATMRIAHNAQRDWKLCNQGAARYDAKIAGSHWIVYYPLGKSPHNGVLTDNYQIALAILNRLESSGGIAVPATVKEQMDDLERDAPGWKVEILSDKSEGAASFDARLRYLDALKLRAFALPERAAIEGQYGTKAEAGDHIDFALTNVETRHKQFCRIINWHAVNELLRLNYGGQYENTVYIKPAPLTDAALAYLRTFYLELMKLPTVEPVEIEKINFDAIREKVGVPLLTDSRESDTEAPPDGADVLQSVVDALKRISTRKV